MIIVKKKLLEQRYFSRWFNCGLARNSFAVGQYGCFSWAGRYSGRADVAVGRKPPGEGMGGAAWDAAWRGSDPGTVVGV